MTDLLKRADDEAFFVMVWATMAIKSDREEQARPYLEFPREAVNSDIASMSVLNPWTFETALNELLSTGKARERSNGRNPRLDCRRFAAMERVAGTLSKLEDAEDSVELEQLDVLRGMHRLAQRQFEWQHGFLRYQPLYRSAFIYGGNLTKTFFREANGISLDDFTLACFVLGARFLGEPVIRRDRSYDEVGLSAEALDCALDRISIPHAAARERAKNLRFGGGHLSYRRSILRDFPCVAFGERGERIHAPLPGLVTLRATSGLFYDFVKKDDNVGLEISKRFEQYCLDILQWSFSGIVVKGSHKYGPKGRKCDSPDLLLYDQDALSVIFECKATRLSYEARFSRDPMTEARRAYEEIAHGVFQIWRFVSHHRRGIHPRQEVRGDVSGVLLTLDSWLIMANVMQREVLDLARAEAAKKDPEITAADQIPIIFCSVDDLETTLRTATDASFLQTVKAAAETQYQGWFLSIVHRRVAPENAADKNYPFKDLMSDVLPWWDRFVPQREQ